MHVVEIFDTIQGEGIYTGTPSIFIRTSFCNLRCDWCDSSFTSWTPEQRKMSVEETVDRSLDLNRNRKHIVITGGEPFIWGKELQQLVIKFNGLNKLVTIETNATIYEEVPFAFISMSPKLSNSTPSKERDAKWNVKHERERLNIPVIKKFLDNNDCQIKFVVSTNEDLAEVEELERKIPLPKEKIVLMPEGRTRKEIQSKAIPLVRYCMHTGYRYSDRLHIQLWNDLRGV